MTLQQLNVPSHEAVYRIEDHASGLLGLIALHSTERGPAAGGLRMRQYPTFDDALCDVTRLSAGMTFKNAATDLPLGGGKAVIIGDPNTQKTPALLRAFGKAIQELSGRYITAEDMGMTPADMAILAEETAYVAGLADGPFASGDPSPSESDIKVTRDLYRAGQMLKIDVLDHIIMGKRSTEHVNDYVSLRELGYFYS